MAPVALVFGALLLVLLLVRGLAYADPKVMLRILRYFGAAGLAVITVLLALTGRLAPALFLGSMAWGLATGGHMWPAGWPHFSGGHWRANSKPGTSSSIKTEWLAMELDHDTGEMRGTVLKGEHARRTLDQMNRDELLSLYREAGRDSESSRVLEAYLDRTIGPEWRTAAGPQAGSAGSGPMTREEAFKILGLQPDAHEDQIRAAHRRLMVQNHPDRGGSDYLAAKINEARDLLLGT
jgi:hypothetical protein